MIHDIAKAVGVELSSRGCNFTIVDGPEESSTTTGARERIVFEYDEDGADAFNVISQTRNPKARGVSRQAAKVTIYAQSSTSGATPFEHRQRTLSVRDLVIVALDDVIRGARKSLWQIGTGHFVRPDETKPSASIPGAAYELKFSFDRAVLDQTFAGQAAPEATVATGMIKSTTKVRTPGEDPSAAETSCGE